MKNVTQDSLGTRIMITGAAGFIGNNPARVSLEHGDHVFVLVGPGSRYRDALPVHDNPTTVERDLDHVPDCIPAIGRADTFLHLAWGGVDREEIGLPKMQARNVSGSLGCVRTVTRLDCTVFMGAGPRVEHGAVEGMMQGDMEHHLVNQYGKAKLRFYRKAAPLCGELNMSYYHLRFFSVCGYGGHPWSTISTLVRDLRQNRRVSLSVCKYQWSFMYIEDAIQVVCELYRHGVPPVGLRSCIVDITSSDTGPLRSFVEGIHKIADFRGELGCGIFVQAKEGTLSVRLDIGRLLGLTGDDWKEEYTFCHGIEETIEKGEANRRHEENQRIGSLL